MNNIRQITLRIIRETRSEKLLQMCLLHSRNLLRLVEERYSRDPAVASLFGLGFITGIV